LTGETRLIGGTIQMKNRFHIVRVPDSLENSDWIVVAPDAEAAARLYVSGVIGDVLSVDVEELAGSGRLEVDLVDGAASGEARLVVWEGEAAGLNLQATPIETEMVSLDIFEEWVSHLEDVGLDP
jgi:hypothetical protein